MSPYTWKVATHQAADAQDYLIKGDLGLESIFYWIKGFQQVSERGPGPHICTGPFYINGAEPGDILEVKILDQVPRYSKAYKDKDRFFGVNVAANWGYQYTRRTKGTKTREFTTLFEIFPSSLQYYAKGVYNHIWGPYTDPDGTVHTINDGVGLLAGKPPSAQNHSILKGIEVPLRPHFGVLGVAPAELDKVSTVPPGKFGGNIDNYRIGKGGTMYYPVQVEGALFSAADAHAAQGDSECDGTAIESSWTGTFQLILHKKGSMPSNSPLSNLGYPLLENKDVYSVHGFAYPDYTKTLGPGYETGLKKATLDAAFEDAYLKTRDFIMKVYGLSEDETVALMSVSVDFIVTQVVDANIGVHALIHKEVFKGK